MERLFEKYSYSPTDAEVGSKISEICSNVEKYYNIDVLKRIFGMMDLTTLNSTDNQDSVKKLCQKVNRFSESFPDMPNVAAICVYPNFVETVKKTITIADFNIASVVGGFPASQTFLYIKTAESKLAVEHGATEADMVISIGEFLDKQYELVFKEVKAIKEAIGDAHLKVILETGALATSENIWKSSLIAMEAGGDFIKTSTGKMQPAATLEAVYVMATAIKEFYNVTKKKIGLKPAGGVADAQTAIKYFAVMDYVLGEEWLTPDFFRFGASSLANNLLTEINKLKSGKAENVKYF